MTFSIVAHDPLTGDVGIAVASKAPAVGSVVPYARAGVGAIASQSCGDFGHGPRGLALIASGESPEQVVSALVTGADPLAAYRQVGIVDARGRSATFSGASCDSWAGGAAGEQFACQGNRLAGPDVVDAMVAAFQPADGDLSVRLAAALLAGDRAGGDRLGRQSAAVLVMREGSPWGFDHRYVDLRVDDHPDAVVELVRILTVWRRAVRLPPHSFS